MKIARFRFTQAVTLVALTLCLAPHARATNLQSGLVAYWPFNDGSGTNLTDAAPADPTADNGTLRNSPTWLSGADGKFGAGLQFDSALSQDVALPVGGDLEPATNALTLSAWVKLDQLPSELTSSFSGIYDSQPDNFVMYLDKGNNELRFKVTTATAVSTATHPGVRASLLNKTDWLHVMGVYDGDKARVKLYFNGQLVDISSLPNVANSGTLTGPLRSGQAAFFGSQPVSATDLTPSSFFKGKISDVAVWNRPLGGAEAQYLYNNGVGHAVGAANPDIAPLAPITGVAPTAQPVIYYKFDGNLNNSGTGGATYNAVLHNDTANAVNNNLYTSATFGQGLDVRENPVSGSVGVQSSTGNGDYLSVDYTLGNSGTIMTRFTLGQLFNFNSLWSNSSHDNDWESWVYADGRVAARANRDTSIVGTTLWEPTLAGPADPAAVHHMAFTWVRDTVDPTQMTVRYFIDGEWVDERVGVWRDPGTTMFIAGGTGGAGNHLGSGVFDEFRVYNAALSEAEILYLSTHAPETIMGLQGDFTSDGKVDAADYVFWRNNLGDTANYNLWRSHFGQTLGSASGFDNAAAVPEPAVCGLLLFSAAVLASRRARGLV